MPCRLYSSLPPFPTRRSSDLPSPWDKDSPRFLNEKTLTLDEFIQKIEKKTGKRIAVAASSGENWIRVLERTSGRRIKTLRIGDRSEEHTSELQSRENLVCRLL